MFYSFSIGEKVFNKTDGKIYEVIERTCGRRCWICFYRLKDKEGNIICEDEDNLRSITSKVEDALIKYFKKLS